MATDFYLQLDGIKGESTDSTHQGWIEVTSANWSINQPRSATASTGGGHTAERVELSEIQLVKIIDLASPMLAQHCACGKTIPKARLEFYRADGAERVKFYEVELENVLIGHISPCFSEGAFPSESLGLKFSKVKWRYTHQKILGGAGGNTAGGWDLALNRVAG